MRQVGALAERGAALVVDEQEVDPGRRVVEREGADQALQQLALAGAGGARDQAVRAVLAQVDGDDAVDAGADLAIGSRYVAGGTVRNWPWRRLALSKTANTYSRLLLGVDVHDITAGYRAYRREVLEKIDLAAVDSKGYCFQIDLTWRTINNGFIVVEVPITFTEREFGQSKMSGSNIREALFKVAEWGIRGRMDRARGVGVTR